jgi:hypothetical protein
MALGFFQQQATDEVRGNLLGELGEEGLVEGCEGVDGFGGWLCEQVTWRLPLLFLSDGGFFTGCRCC